jgi:hypothetical protein
MLIEQGKDDLVHFIDIEPLVEAIADEVTSVKPHADAKAALGAPCHATPRTLVCPHKHASAHVHHTCATTQPDGNALCAETLKAMGYKLGVISNITFPYASSLRREGVQLHDLFDAHLASCEVTARNARSTTRDACCPMPPRAIREAAACCVLRAARWPRTTNHQPLHVRACYTGHDGMRRCVNGQAGLGHSDPKLFELMAQQLGVASAATAYVANGDEPGSAAAAAAGLSCTPLRRSGGGGGGGGVSSLAELAASGRKQAFC